MTAPSAPAGPAWGTAPPERRRPGKLVTALSSAAVVVVAVVVGLIVSHNTTPPPPGQQAGPTPAAITASSQAPDFHPPTGGVLLSPGASPSVSGLPTIGASPSPAPSGSASASPSPNPSGSASASASASSSASSSASQTPPPDDPVSVTKAYYGDLEKNDTTDAFGLLCQVTQQSIGQQSYTSSYEADRKAGTGVKQWVVGNPTRIQGDEAAVPGTLTLDNGRKQPITVLLLHEAAGWRVCSSNLGGVLPDSGSGSGGGTGTA